VSAFSHSDASNVFSHALHEPPVPSQSQVHALIVQLCQGLQGIAVTLSLAELGYHDEQDGFLI
jgi:hypothetical protein